MDLNRFTEKMQEALQSAQSRAIRRSHQQLDVEHLLAALLAPGVRRTRRLWRE